MQIRNITTLVLAASALLQFAAPAVAQDAARRCLEAGIKPILRNADGSLSPNPDFDTCLAGRPIMPPPAKNLPAVSNPAASVVRPRDGAGSPPANPAAPAPTAASSGSALAPIVVRPSAAAAAPGASIAPAPAVVKSEPLPPPAPPRPKWMAGNGQDVQEVLSTWAKRAGWTVVWNAPTWQVAGNLTYEGEFLDAVRGLMRPYVIQKKLAKPEIYPEHSQNLIYISEPK